MNEKNKRVKNNLSGALWLFTIAIFLLGTLSGYIHSWLLFIVAGGFQALLEAYFHSRD